MGNICRPCTFTHTYAAINRVHHKRFKLQPISESTLLKKRESLNSATRVSLSTSPHEQAFNNISSFEFEPSSSSSDISDIYSASHKLSQHQGDYAIDAED